MPVIRRTNLLLDQNVTFNQPDEGNESLPPHLVKLGFGYKCMLCQSFPETRTSVEQHANGRSHQSMLALMMLKNNQQFALANKNDVSVKLILEHDTHTEPSLYTFSINKGHQTTLIARITNASPKNVKLDFCDFTVVGEARAVYKVLPMTTSKPNIPSNGQFDIMIRVFAPNVGKFSKTLFLKFGGGISRDSFYIVRPMSAICTDEIIDELRPTEPYKPVARAQVQYGNLEIVPGLKIAKCTDDQLVMGLPLTPFRIPPVFRSSVNHGLKDNNIHYDVAVQEEIRIIREVMTSPLTFENYVQKWMVLLRLEKLQADISVQQYNMANVHMTICRENTRFLVLQVPGLAENRPSLLKGDALFVSFTGTDAHDKEYQGHVHNVHQSEVWLGFSETLHDRCTKESLSQARFNVRFGVPEHVYRLQQRAINMVPEVDQLQHLLFPTADKQNKTPAMHPLNAQLRFYNQDVNQNDEQARAVRHIVSGSSRPAPYLLFGPPGTGKTVTLVESILQILRTYPDAHILACAPSNSAADLLTERLAGYLKQSAKEKLFRMHARSRPWITVSEYIKEYSNYRKGDYYYPAMSTIAQYPVVLTTMATAGRLVSAKFPAGHFTHLFIDECGQATEPECMVAMVGVLSYDTTEYPKGGQVVLAGDPKQLGPIVHSPYANKFGLEKSYLERLMLTVPIYQRLPDGANPPYDVTVLTELRQNYRSHPAILEQPNTQFYHGDLLYSADKTEREMFTNWDELPNKNGFPVLFHGSMGEELREGKSPSFFNPAEISIVMDYVEKLLEQRTQTFRTSDIAIITPYRKQVQKLQRILSQRKLESIKVGTVEEFQGQERKVIIISTVRSNPDYLEFDTTFKLGFVANPKKYNVAITRAMSLLLIVGNPRCLMHDLYWYSFIKYCRDNNALLGSEMLDNFDLPDMVKQMLALKMNKTSVNVPESIDTSNYYSAPELTRDHIVMVSDLDAFRQCTNEISQPGSIVGIDGEWTPQFRTSSRQSLSTIQLAVRQHVYILDVIELKQKLPAAEWKTFAIKLFNNADVVKVFFQAGSDLSMILQSFPHLKDQLHPSKLEKLTDIYIRAMELERIDNFFPVSGSGNNESKELSELVRKCLGKPLYKGQQLSDWDQRPIPEDQIRYAAIDAFALLGCYEHLKGRMEALNITSVDLFKKLNNKFWNNLFPADAPKPASKQQKPVKNIEK